MNNKPFSIINTFKYSCNIKSDYLEETKINSFLPTYNNIEYYRQLIKGITNGSNKAILLSGAYGTGKSYLASIVCATLTKNNLNLNPLSQKISRFVPDISVYEEIICKSNYLIIFPSDYVSSFHQAISLGLMECISTTNKKISLQTVYNDIINKINHWKTSEPFFYSRLKLVINDVEQLISNLKEFNPEALNIFKKSYSKIMGGEVYFPSNFNSSINQIMNDFEIQATNLGYDGVIYLFDEFGRFLESNINSIDVKEIQDAAEFCNRTDSKSNLMLISHKGLFQYADKLQSIDDRNEWDKVSGRFFHIHTKYKESNVPELVENIVIKNDAFKEYKNKFKDEFVKYFDKFHEIQSGEDEQILEQIFPLNYLTAKFLPLLSARVGQNDRTFFTFLCGDENHSLKDSWDVNLNSFSTITPDVLYDYFNDSFSFLNIRSTEYRVYNTAENLLRLTTNKDERKLLKSLALFQLIGLSESIESTKEFLSISISMDSKSCYTLLSQLTNKDLICYRRHTKHYYLAIDYDFNIDKDVENYIDKTLGNNLDYSKILQSITKNNYLYPIKYNWEKKITRYYNCIYYLDSELNINSNKINKDHNGDACLISILNTDNFDHSNSYQIFGHANIALYNPSDTISIKRELQEYEALIALSTTQRYISDNVAKEELEKYKNELIGHINNKIESHFDSDTLVLISKTKKNISKKDLDYYLSIFLEAKYFNYVPINYDIINKTKLSVPVKTARKSIIGHILNNDFEDGYFEKTGSENSIARIVLKNTGIYNFTTNSIDLNNSILNEFFQSLLKYLKESNNNLYSVYHEYTRHTSGYGFRKGLFTLLLSVFIKHHLSNVYLIKTTKGIENEVNFTPIIFNDIELKPSDYSINYYVYSTSQINYINDIRKFLILYVHDSNFDVNPAESLMNAFREYLYSKPSLLLMDNGVTYSHKNDILQLISKITSRTPRHFWFHILPDFINSNNFSSITSKFLNLLSTLDQEEKLLEDKLKLIIKENVNKVFNSDIDNTLTLLNTFSEQIEFKNSKSHNEIYKIFSMNNEKWLDLLTENISGFSYRKWTELSQIDTFDHKFQRVLNSYTGKIKNGDISDFTKLSSLAKVLKSRLNSQILNFGQAITKEEKKQILVELLEEN